jgi:hypothetical protein
LVQRKSNFEHIKHYLISQTYDPASKLSEKFRHKVRFAKKLHFGAVNGFHKINITFFPRISKS